MRKLREKQVFKVVWNFRQTRERRGGEVRGGKGGKEGRRGRRERG